MNNYDFGDESSTTYSNPPWEVETDCNPLDDIDDAEAERQARKSVDDEEPQDKRTKRLINELNARLSVNAFTVPTEEEMIAIELSDGQDFTVYDPQGFSEANFHIEYLVDRVLVENQPAVVAGPSKSLKTSVSIDLAISLASGTPFLGQYGIAEPKRVLFLSAESGLGVIRCTASRICLARSMRLPEIPIHWGGWVPRVKFVRQLAALRSAIRRSHAQVVFIDPVYQSIDGTDAANVALMGQQLKDICDQVLHFDATPILVHHSTKTSIRVLNREPLEIHDLAGAGVTEFFRQWVLLNRREAFSPDNPHRLWLSAGGSAGHASHFALDIDEDRDEEGKCHGWDVTMQRGDEARQDAANGAAERRAKVKQQTFEATRNRHIEEIKKAYHGNGDSGLTKTDIVSRSGVNNANAGIAVAKLLREGWLEPCDITKNGKKLEGYRRKNDHPNNPNSPNNSPELLDCRGE